MVAYKILPALTKRYQSYEIVSKEDIEKLRLAVEQLTIENKAAYDEAVKQNKATQKMLLEMYGAKSAVYKASLKQRITMPPDLLADFKRFKAKMDIKYSNMEKQQKKQLAAAKSAQTRAKNRELKAQYEAERLIYVESIPQSD